MTEETGFIPPVCPNCKKKGIYFRKDGSVRCKACGYEGPIEGKK